MKTATSALLCNFLLLFIATPVYAHDSFAMYVHKGTVTVKGEVTKFQWINPLRVVE